MPVIGLFALLVTEITRIPGPFPDGTVRLAVAVIRLEPDEEVRPPIKPVTNAYTMIAAATAIAMRRSVAMTGETALLLFLRQIFMRFPVNPVSSKRSI